MGGRWPRKPWNKFVTAENTHLVTPEAIDFIDKLLRYDHQERLTAQEAMNHPYLAPVRQDGKRKAGDEIAASTTPSAGASSAAAASAAPTRQNKSAIGNCVVPQFFA